MNIIVISQFDNNEVHNIATSRSRHQSLAFYLAKNGHNVRFITSNFSHQSKEFINKNLLNSFHGLKNLEINVIETVSYKRHIGLYRLLNLILTASRFKEKLVLEFNPDIIIMSYPTIELLTKVLKPARKTSTKVLIDVIDLWPKSFIIQKNTILKHMISTYSNFVNHALSKVSTDIDGVVGITKSYSDWFSNETNLSLISNYFHLGSKREVRDISKKNQQFSVVFLGTISRQFNFAPIFEAALMDSSINYYIIGDGDMYEDCVKRTSKLKNIIWTGWKSQENIRLYLQTSSVAILPYHDLPHFQKNITNKFSEYLTNGLPILTGVSGEMRELLEQHHCGVFYSDSEELINHVIEYKNNPELLRQQSSNAIELHREQFDIDQINEQFLQFIEEVHTRYHNG